MNWTSVLAIYFLAWVFAAFVMLPFGVRTSDEAGEAKVPGQADSAPHQFDLRRHMWRAALVGAVITALYVANFHFGWLTVEDLDFWN
jgi:predicted secreted protein